MIVGFANGCWDIFHEGHRHFLTECRKHCTYLIVAVNTDAYCKRVKGRDRPYDPLERRMLHVRGLAEAVIPFEGREDLLIVEIRPDVVFAGSDHKNGVTELALRGIGWKDGAPIWKAPIVHIDRLPGFSTTLAAQGRTDAPKPDARHHPSRLP